MKRRTAAILLLASALVSCSPFPTGGATPPTSASETSSPAAGSVVGTVVRFSAGSVSLDVTIGEDNPPATRDFLSMLPLTLTMEEFAGKEKIADLPRPLDYEGGSPGSDPPRMAT